MFNTAGTFYYTNKVQGLSQDSDCPEPTAVTNAGTLTVVVSDSSPAIQSPPANLAVGVGGTATFNVVATGCRPVTYQWWFNGMKQIAGATSAMLTFANVQLTNMGNYSVTVSNPNGSVNSAPAVLTVLLPPVITNQPTGQTVCAGTTVHFSVTATGWPLSYQWYKGNTQLSDGGNVSGSTTPTLTLANVSGPDAANYTVVVSNGNQGVTSSAATLVVQTTCIAPTIVTSPQSQNATAGAIVSFTVGVNQNAGQPLFYQWQKNGVNLIDGGEVFGATTATLTLQGVAAADAGSYTVTVSNGGGFATSAAAILSVSGTCGINITTQPASCSATAGNTVTFSVAAQGSGLTYQWLKDANNLSDGGNVSGSQTLTLTLVNVSPADTGRYTVYVCSPACCVASQPATLTVNGFNVRITEPKDNAILP
ncbi:MAG: immunoglobulin domain-containing protein [Verrucomicrobiia bacterium]